MKKKFLVLSLAVALVFTACGSKEANEMQTEPMAETTVESTVEFENETAETVETVETTESTEETIETETEETKESEDSKESKETEITEESKPKDKKDEPKETVAGTESKKNTTSPTTNTSATNTSTTRPATGNVSNTSGNTSSNSNNSNTSANSNNNSSSTPAVHTHSYSERIIQAATCESNGEKEFSCECGEKYTESIAATGHDMHFSHANAGCGNNPGHAIYKCSVCGKEEDRGVDPWYSGGVCVGGDWVVNEPTCTQEGLKARYCIYCNYIVESERLPALGHDWQPNGTSEVQVNSGQIAIYSKCTCSRCGESYNDSLLEIRDINPEPTPEPTPESSVAEPLSDNTVTE